MRQTKSKAVSVELDKDLVIEETSDIKVFEVDPRQSTCILNGNRVVYSGTGVKEITLNAPFKYEMEVEK